MKLLSTFLLNKSIFLFQGVRYALRGFLEPI